MCIMISIQLAARVRQYENVHVPYACVRIEYICTFVQPWNNIMTLTLVSMLT